MAVSNTHSIVIRNPCCTMHCTYSLSGRLEMKCDKMGRCGLVHCMNEWMGCSLIPRLSPTLAGRAWEQG